MSVGRERVSSLVSIATRNMALPLDLLVDMGCRSSYRRSLFTEREKLLWRLVDLVCLSSFLRFFEQNQKNSE